jgi:hypothetical protein
LSAVGSRSYPSMEIWKSRLSAEPIPGVDATVAPIPQAYRQYAQPSQTTSFDHDVRSSRPHWRTPTGR